MANRATSVAVDSTNVTVGADLSQAAADAQATADSTATSVDGISTAAAAVTEAVGVLDSSVVVGGDATFQISETAASTGLATSVNGVNLAITSAATTIGSIGDVVLNSAGVVLGYITTIGTGTAAPIYTKDGGTTAFLVDGNLIGASSSFSGITGETGGFIDSTSATDLDFIVGGRAVLDVQVANTATAAAQNTKGDAYANGLIIETYGLQDIGVRVGGGNSILSANVDADVSSTATTTGLASSAAAALANTDAYNVAAIKDLGDGSSAATSDFVFGDNVTITANAGTLSDRVTLSAVATTVGGTARGDATATSDSRAISGITDATGSDNGTSNVLSVGADATITARAYVDSTARAVSVAGDANGSSDLAAVDGIQADTVIAGDDATIKAFANTTGTASASSIDLTAYARNMLRDSRAIQLDNLTLGDSAVDPAAGSGRYGVIGAASANLAATASSLGDASGEFAKSEALNDYLIGVQLGDGVVTTADRALSAGGSLSLAGTADLAAATIATAGDGSSTATSLSTTATTGVSFNQSGASTIGSNGTILATGSVNLDATASNIGTAATAADDAATGQAGADKVIGFEMLGAASELAIGESGALTGSASVLADASATSVEANANAFAGGDSRAASGLDVYGVNTDDAGRLAIGSSGKVDATATSTLNATAATISKAATAIVDANQSEGLLSEAISIGAAGTINAAASLSGKAAASSVDDDAIARAEVGRNIGFEADAAVSVGAAGTFGASASLVLQAIADTIGDDSDTDAATARTGEIGSTSENIGWLADAANTSIGAGGTVVGAASLTTSAAASGVQADVEAQSLMARNLGIDLGNGSSGPSSSGRTLSIGDDGAVSGSANGSSSTVATTTNGDALALSDVDLTAGLGAGSGLVTIGANGTINGTAISIGSAIAAAIDADDDLADDIDVEATVSHDLVSGIDLGILRIGDSATLSASASSTQSASASNVGDPSPLDASTVRALVADGNAITGLDSTSVEVGRDLAASGVNAQLRANASASNINSRDSITAAGVTIASARAASGLGSAVIGIDDSDLKLGRDVSGANGLRADAISTLDASASGVAGTVEAAAGDAAARVIGINSSDLTVGGSANTTAVAASSLRATASSIAGDASADAQQRGDGLLNSAVRIGNDGNVSGQATLAATAGAVTVGSAASPDDAWAGLSLSSSGIDQSGVAGATIAIGDSGNVSGSGFASGASNALTIDGKANASGLIEAQGIDLRSTSRNSDITIDGTGSIAGLAVIGMLNGAGGLGAPVTVTATSTAGTADANGDFDAEGIAGLEDLPPLYLNPTLLIAGPLRGDVSGQAMAGGQVTASTIGRTSADTATATNTLSQLFGLRNVDIVAGLTGTNLVKGTAFGDFGVNAVSVAGDSKATSNSDVYGIFDESGKGNISLSGNLNAIAQLTNYASTKSVAGKSSSDARGEAIGLNGYGVNLLTSGNLVASAFSRSESRASSVSGAASA